MEELREEIRKTIEEAEKLWDRGGSERDFTNNYRKMLKLLKKIESSLCFYEG